MATAILTEERTAEAPACAPEAHLVHVFPSFGHGGVPIRITTIVNHFGARYRHTVIALDGNTAAASRLDGAAPVDLLDPEIDKSRPIASLFRIRRRLVDLAPDLLLTYNWGAVEWALVNRIGDYAPHVHLESGFGPEEADGQLPRRVTLRRVALTRARCLVVPSHTLVDIATRIWLIPPGRVRHIPNGVDCERFAGPPDPAVAPGLARAPGGLVVGTLAPLRPEKNLARLIRAFAAVAERHDAKLLIAGDGAERPALEAAARALGVGGRVVFAGHVERPDKAFGLMDVFAISSDTEQMPNTLIQAMAASRPVVGTDVGDVKANLAPANRPYVVAKSDEQGFAAVLDRLLGDAALRQGLGAANREHVRAFYSQERMFAAYGAVYDAVLGPRGARA